MFLQILCLVLIGQSSSVTSEDDNYSVYRGYKIIEVNPQTKLQSSSLHELEDKIPSINFLSSSKLLDVPQLILVDPKVEKDLLALFNRLQLANRVVTDDVLLSVQNERLENLKRRASLRVDFESYLRYDDITKHLEELAEKYPKQVKLVEVGKTYEGRQMNALKITDDSESRSDKKVIFMDAGIHAREWIAPATALFVIHQLVENLEANRDLLKDYDWLILPVVNPDGYEYSHTKERFWRKTRQPNALACVGTDANRNFDFHWGETGASSYACSETYKGSKAFSEPETEAVRQILQSFNGNCKMYLSLHSYGNYLLYPWGYDSTLPPTWKDLDEVAQAGGNAIRSATGTKYTVGSATNVLYAAAGASDDYAFGAANIPISITMELPGGGRGGFDPPPSKIKPFVEEAWIGIKAMAQTVAKKY